MPPAQISPTQPTLLISGARSQIGDYLLPMLLEQGHTVVAVSRRPPPQPWPKGLTWIEADLSGAWSPPQASAYLHLAPLWLLPPHIERLAQQGVRRVIAFGSTSRYTKTASASAKERQLAARLTEAEEAVAKLGQLHGVAWTVLRPTLVYGRGRDRNITDIACFIRRYGFFPIAGRGRGLRQPVHAADLASACCQALAQDATMHRAYNLPGGETLTFRAMVERIFAGQGRAPRVLPLPVILMQLGVRLARLLPRYRHLTPAMVTRFDQDLCFDMSEATRDLGYAPRPFSVESESAQRESS